MHLPESGSVRSVLGIRVCLSRCSLQNAQGFQQPKTCLDNEQCPSYLRAQKDQTCVCSRSLEDGHAASNKKGDQAKVCAAEGAGHLRDTCPDALDPRWTADAAAQAWQV